MSLTHSELDQEFAPLPFFPWDERPASVPLDTDECATAIHLAHGDLLAASHLIKTPLHRLARLVRHSPRLQRVVSESLESLQAHAVHEYAKALADPDGRVRWAAAQKIMASKLAAAHPLSPALAGTATSTSLTVSPAANTMTFRWRTDADDAMTIVDDGHDSSAGS